MKTQSNNNTKMNRITTINLIFSALCRLSACAPHHFHLINKMKSWTEAQRYCRETYTDLATVHSMDEMKELNETLTNSSFPRPSVWIGLQRGVTKKWMWSLADTEFYKQGETEFRKWETGEPSDSTTDLDCAARYSSDGLWRDENCNQSHSFVCYDGVTDSYQIFKENKTSWREAQRFCRERYTDLASVRNDSENSNVSASFHTWIGLFRDSWTWSDQSNSSFRHWTSDQPDNLNGSEGCAAVRTIGADFGQWEDLDCDEQMAFVCRESDLVLVRENLTWSEALKHCRENNMDLVSVHSEEIQRSVVEVAKNASTSHVWLGLRHTRALDLWFWVSGTFTCYDNWALGNGTGVEDCSTGERTGAVQTGGEQKWVSLPENQTLNFICSRY
ncbi:C-type mannose receptor 2-like [Colossoma macropomum]|uniref:C-type mannose receptor 2-like n=1 Tax=Colossoma macropomum TaxID=42526 RepID=UPI0018640A19|nr:C-type mannose receptor 2-like [Colossoma macropomum]